MLTIVLTRSFSGVILETGSYFSTASSTSQPPVLLRPGPYCVLHQPHSRLRPPLVD